MCAGTNRSRARTAASATCGRCRWRSQLGNTHYRQTITANSNNNERGTSMASRRHPPRFAWGSPRRASPRCWCVESDLSLWRPFPPLRQFPLRCEQRESYLQMIRQRHGDKKKERENELLKRDVNKKDIFSRRKAEELSAI